MSELNNRLVQLNFEAEVTLMNGKKNKWKSESADTGLSYPNVLIVLWRIIPLSG